MTINERMTTIGIANQLDWAAAELEAQLAAAQERNTALQSEHLDHVIRLYDQLTAANAEIERLGAELSPLGLPAPFIARPAAANLKEE